MHAARQPRSWLIFDVGQKMKLKELVILAFSRPLSPSDVAQVCTEMGVSRTELFDAFARNVVDGYSKKEYSWSDSDVAMNALFAFVYAIPGDDILSEYAFHVFSAFDEGEYQRGGEAATQKLLSKLR